MAESSGSLKLSNGSHVNGKMNGGHTAGRKRPVPKRRSFIARLFSVIARIATWTAIATILFRCPSSLEACNETSPVVCQHYFRAKAAVSPFTQPYYEQYVGPYADFVRPYYETVDTHVFTPTRVIAVQYGAPWVKKGQEHALAQWEKYGQPRVTQLRVLSQEKYEQSIAPYLDQAGQVVQPYYEIGRTNSLQLFYEFLLPTYEFVQPYALQGYNAASNFTIGTALPAAHWTWNKTNAFLDTAVWPQMRVVYIENVEPQLVRIGERLERYKNRAKTKVLPDAISTGKRSPASDASTSSFGKPAPQSTVSSAPTSSEQQPTSVTSADAEEPTEERYWNPVQAPPAAEDEDEQRRLAREMVAQDLATWQNKFAAQADEGANAIEDKVDEISTRMINEQAIGKGRPLVQKLESIVRSETESLKAKIPDIIADNTEHSELEIEEQLIGAVRSAGVAIKKAAQAIRSWREDYDEDLQDEVLSAADGHFAILDGTQNLALQQIGMKWAWTDGVTYKDWAKYHELKSALTLWTDELKQLVVTHPALLEAQEASAEIEDDGMTIASAAARELARLKQVALWKLAAKDTTDNFDSDKMKLAAEEAQKVPEKEGGDESVVHKQAESGAADPVEGEERSASSSSVSEQKAAPEAVSSISEPVIEVAPSASDIAEEESGEDIENSLDSSVADSNVATSVSDASDASDASEINTDSVVTYQTSELPKEATNLDSENEILGDTNKGTTGPLDDLAEEPEFRPSQQTPILGSEEKEAASSTLVEHPISTGAVDPDSILTAEERSPDSHAHFVAENEDIQKPQDEPSTPEAASVKPAFLGAAAQVVPNRQPILDEDDDTDDFLSSATSAAEAAYSSAISLASGHYSSAVSVVSAQIYGTPEPVHDELLASVSAAYSNAIAAASSRLGDVFNAASSGVYGTPITTASATPTPLMDWSKVESIASERLNDGKLWAELRYQSALIAMGLATPTPTKPADGYYEHAKYNYYAGLGLAHDRYSSFVSAASSAWSSITATPSPTTGLTDSATQLASAARESAASAYSVASKNVKSAVDAVDESIAGIHDAAAEQIYLAGVAVVDTWETVISQISAQVYNEPTQIGWYDSLANGATATDAVAGAFRTASADAAKHYEAVSELVSELVLGREQPFTESVFSRLSGAYVTAAGSVESLASEASAAAGSVGQKVGSMMSRATETAKEASHNGKDEL